MQDFVDFHANKQTNSNMEVTRYLGHKMDETEAIQITVVTSTPNYKNKDYNPSLKKNLIF